MPYIFLLSLCLLILNACATSQQQPQSKGRPVVIHAARLFDGYRFKTNVSVLIENDKIVRVDKRSALADQPATMIDLGDATILPGFIELHAHLGYRHVPAETVLRHGITTVRDVGGPVHQPYGGSGSLRVLTSGPIITASGGYPIPSLGATDIAIPVATAEEARRTVRDLVQKGAVVIKVALEPGLEQGAPWHSAHHHERPPHHANAHNPWPLLSEAIVEAIVDEAHHLDRRTSAHIGERRGAEIAVNAGIDEWAHIPCAQIPVPLLESAVTRHTTFVTTMDTLSRCRGVVSNIRHLAAAGAHFLYGAEIGHPDIPWGIDANELLMMKHLTGRQMLEILQSATSRAGSYLGIPLLGTVQAGAPADLIAVSGNPVDNLKALEYPLFVMSGGKTVLRP